MDGDHLCLSAFPDALVEPHLPTECLLYSKPGFDHQLCHSHSLPPFPCQAYLCSWPFQPWQVCLMPNRSLNCMTLHTTQCCRRLLTVSRAAWLFIGCPSSRHAVSLPLFWLIHEAEWVSYPRRGAKGNFGFDDMSTSQKACKATKLLCQCAMLVVISAMEIPS